jgi:RNA polymerase sigma-70 factor (ECF subfamily)
MHTTRASLLIRLKDPRNNEAWTEFDGIYRPMLFRFAQARGLGHSDAEDVVQYCMAAVNKHIQGFDYDPKRGRFKSWLRTMVNNRCRNMFRDRKEQVAESQDFRLAQANSESPEETFDRIWTQEHLRHCLRLVRDEVDSTTFTAFKRYAVDGRATKEVCEELDITSGQLYKIKWRMTQKLRERMTELLGSD